MSYFGIPVRNGLPIGLGTVAPLGINNSAFSPASFFANGEQGWWYDPSNFATLFQDSAGTTPVTAVEQPVGLQLDLSKGLVLGPELFSSSVGLGATARNARSVLGTVTATSATVSSNASGTFGINFPALTPSIGKAYAISLSYASSPSKAVTLNFGGLNFTSSSSTITGYFVATTSTSLLDFFVNAAASGEQFTISSISVKELPGNHRFQSTSANRPVVSARVNLLTKTEQFDDAAWTKVNATVEAAPDSNAPGVMFAIKSATDAATSSNRYIGQTASIFASTQYKAVFFAKAGGINSVRFFLRNDDATRDAYFDVSTGTVTSTSNTTASISLHSGSVYRCEVTWTSGADTSVLPSINNGVSVFGDGAIMFYASAPDIRVANQGVNLPVYQRVNTSTDYDSTGFPVYIKPNGSNQFMQTNSINFTATDKMTVWQGVRKLSDASQRVVAELSASIAANNGTFLLTAPDSAAANYNFASKGTTQVDNIVTTYTSPITNVLVGIGDISGSINSVKVNGGAATTVTSSQGTGNYGTYPAYFYARAGTSLYFSGNDYGSIARGAASTAAQIAAGETYINSKTKAY
jgi:hypothetical protein